MIYHDKKIPCGLPELPSNVFIVSARQGGCCRQYIVIATDADDACARLRANAAAMIEEIKAGMKPEDYEKANLFAEPLPHSLKRAYELEEEIQSMNEELVTLEDRDDELAIIHRETLNESVRSKWKEIKRLREPIPSGKSSTFEMVARPMLEILQVETKITAQHLSGDRCYTASYFDDFRSYSSFCG